MSSSKSASHNNSISHLKPRINIVIPVLNEANTIEDSLRHLILASGIDTIVVVDGGSTDDTLKRARAFQTSMRRRVNDVTPRIEVICTDEAGRGRQMNAGANHIKTILSQDRSKKNTRKRGRQQNCDREGNTSSRATNGTDNYNDNDKGETNDNNGDGDVDVIGFVHSDTFLPQDGVNIAGSTLLQDKSTVAVGFHTIIEYKDKTFWAVSLHNTLKTHYIPAILKPLCYCAGLRLLFGDQCMFMRIEDYDAVGGFDESHLIMEDADLCWKLHNIHKLNGNNNNNNNNNDTPCTKSISHTRHTRPGKIQLINRCVRTSGRRIDHVGGTLRATYIHFVVAFSWWCGMSQSRLRTMYHNLYMGDKPR